MLRMWNEGKDLIVEGRRTKVECRGLRVEGVRLEG